MKLFKKLKEKRETKKAIRDPYSVEELRLNLQLQKLTPGTPEYKEIQQELKATNQMRAESRESRRRISKTDKGGIIIKILGLGGAAAGLFSIIKAERDGLTFTGEKRTVMDAISRGIGNIFVKH